MTRNSDVPDRWPAPKPSQSRRKRQLPNSPTDTSSSETGQPTDVPVSGTAAQLSLPQDSQQQGQQNGAVEPYNRGQISVKKRKSSRWRFLAVWQFWAAVAVFVSGGVGFTAMALLLKLPALPNCPTIFWPTASASMRLYCAQLAANKQTMPNLLEAIALVKDLPPDHPLRVEIDRNIEQWSADILDLAEQAFQAGKLDEAIASARKIPSHVTAAKLVEERVERWQSIWSKAEEIYQKSQADLKSLDWHKAFNKAVRLTSVGNKYWETTKYEELRHEIEMARQDIDNFNQAQELVKKDGVKNLLAAIKLVSEVGDQSYVYKEAQNLIATCGNQLLNIAKERLEKQDWQQVMEIANQLPSSLNLQAETEDLLELARAQARAEGGSVSSLEAAIAQTQRIEIGRPMYAQAQALITRWQREIEDVAHLERARNLAKSGNANDVTAAIAELQLIPNNNPRYQEAQKEKGRWNNQIETQEDRPYLDNAERVASLGDVTALQSAIAEASKISKGRALYQEAQSKIAQWNRKIQRTEDQPDLDRAESLANSGNLSEAITTAAKIPQGRALYDEAQAKIRGWRQEIQVGQRLKEAYQIASSGSPDAITSAIRTARELPGSVRGRSDVKEAINSWSYQLLTIAQGKAGVSITEAIAIAKNIPSGTAAYETAQNQIQSWQKAIAPPTPIAQPSITPTSVTPQPVINKTQSP